MNESKKQNREVQYEVMFGREANEAIHSFPVGYLPIGCLERHGDHLPMGTDALRAHKICCLVAQALGGVVFPPHHYAGIHKMTRGQLEKYTAEWGNIYTDKSARDSLVDIINQIALMNIRVLILYSGHYPPCQVQMMREISEKFSIHATLSVIPFCESMIIQGDHAGICETSFMLYLEPELVRMDHIKQKNYLDHGWQQHNSPEKASSEKGANDLRQILDYLKREILKNK
ncbi:hypothetical protein GF337_16835 [candidate division KSB1 bacterium]|nr:hypothetical protein [candidate division KSB1 bacterium]